MLPIYDLMHMPCEGDPSGISDTLNSIKSKQLRVRVEKLEKTK